MMFRIAWDYIERPPAKKDMHFFFFPFPFEITVCWMSRQFFKARIFLKGGKQKRRGEANFFFYLLLFSYEKQHKSLSELWLNVFTINYLQVYSPTECLTSWEPQSRRLTFLHYKESIDRWILGLSNCEMRGRVLVYRILTASLIDEQLSTALPRSWFIVWK